MERLTEISHGGVPTNLAHCFKNGVGAGERRIGACIEIGVPSVDVGESVEYEVPGEEGDTGLIGEGVAERAGLALWAARIEAVSLLSFDVVTGMGIRSRIEEMLSSCALLEGADSGTLFSTSTSCRPIRSKDLKIECTLALDEGVSPNRVSAH